MSSEVVNGGQRGMKFSGQDVIRTFRRLEEGGVPVWLDGGWGVDALLRRETRMHRDVDIVVPLDCLAAAEFALAEEGFAKDDSETNMPTRLVLRNSEGLAIDIYPVTFKSDGSAVHLDTDKGGAQYPYLYSAAGFSGIGTVNGRVVRCVPAAEQIRQKVRRRYSPWSEARAREGGLSADLVDIDSLLEVFGVIEGERAQGSCPKPWCKSAGHGLSSMLARAVGQAAAMRLGLALASSLKPSSVSRLM